MTAPRALLTIPLALLLAGCGSPVRPAGPPIGTAATARPAATAAATPAATAVPPPPPPLIVLAEPAGKQTRVTLVDVSGREVAAASVPADQAWLVEAGPGGAYWIDGGHLHRLGAGGVADLGAVPSYDGGGFSVSPGGTAIVFHTATQLGTAPRFDNRLYVAEGGSSRLLASRIADGDRPVPGDAPGSLWQYRTLGWTDTGIVIAREPQGGCGCGPFGMESVDWHTALVDPVTGATTAVSDSDTCPLSGTDPGGLAACFHTAIHGESATADQLRILHAGTVTARFDLSGANVGGAAVFSTGGSRLAYATVPQGADCATWRQQARMRVLDLAGGGARVIPTAGLQPLAWLPDGRIVAVQTLGATVVTTRVVLVDPGSGAITSIHSAGESTVVRVAAAA